MKLSVLSRRPSLTAKVLALDAVFRWNPFAIIRALLKCDVFILGGGGLFQDKTSTRSLLYYLTLVEAAVLLRRRVVLYAVGVEPLRPSSRLLLRVVANSLQGTITVRDVFSKDQLLQLGIPSSKIHVVADPVFAFEPAAPGKFATPSPKKILFIPRDPGKPVMMSLYKSLYKRLKEREGCVVVTMLFQGDAEKDAFKEFEPAMVFSMGMDPEQFAEEISKHDYVVSARYHGLVLASLSGIPFLGVGSSEKIVQFCRHETMPLLSWNAHDDEIESGLSSCFSKSQELRNEDQKRWREAAEMAVGLVG